MEITKVAESRLGNWFVTALHQVTNAVRGRQRHVLFTGTDPSSLAGFIELLREAIPEVGIPQTSQDALITKTSFSPLVTSWSATDLASISDITAALGPFRSISVAIFVTDPRATVSKATPEAGDEWVSNADYSLDPNGSGLTLPGVLAQFSALRNLQQSAEVDLIAIRPGMSTREQEEIASRIQHALRLAENKSVNSWLNRVSAQLLENSKWPSDALHINHLRQQLALHPELEDASRAAGFAPSEVSNTKSAESLGKASGKVIGFYTPDEVYRKEAERLGRSLDSLHLDYELFEVAAEEDWVRTTLLKPQWMLKARQELTGPLLYIDVDAYVHQNPWPYLSQYTADLAAVYDYGILNSATIFINDTSGAREMLSRWKTLAEKRLNEREGTLEQTGEDSDQTVLRDIVDEVLHDNSPAFSFQHLPMNMAYIFDGRHRHELVGPVYIEQLQASRESTKHEKRLARRRQRLQELDPPGS